MAIPRTILLTGATGFIGSHLFEELLNQGYQVIILKRSTSDTWRVDHLLDQVKFYNVDTAPLSKVFDENLIDIVIHLATLYRKFDDGHDVSQMIEANISFPVELIELAARNDVKAFINTGTFFECDCSQLPVNENAMTKPFNFYAKTKSTFQAILDTYAETLRISTLRLFSPYGERDNNKLIPLLVKHALSNEQIVLSDGLQKLDFIYVGDVVDAYIKAVEKVSKSQLGHNIYNIGSGVGTSVREVVSVIEQAMGQSINKQWGEASSVDYPVVFADNSKAEMELCWKPDTTIHQGIAKLIKYYKYERSK